MTSAAVCTAAPGDGVLGTDAGLGQQPEAQCGRGGTATGRDVAQAETREIDAHQGRERRTARLRQGCACQQAVTGQGAHLEHEGDHEQDRLCRAQQREDVAGSDQLRQHQVLDRDHRDDQETSAAQPRENVEPGWGQAALRPSDGGHGPRLHIGGTFDPGADVSKSQARRQARHSAGDFWPTIARAAHDCT